MRNMILLALLFVYSCNESKNYNKFTTEINTIVKSISPADSLKEISDNDTLLFQNITHKDLNNTNWFYKEFILDIYYNGFNNRQLDISKYPYERLEIENWKKQNLYSEGLALDYRKFRITIKDDSTYYITNWNKHHYKNNDSLFLSKRNNQISIISKKDSLPYTSHFGSYDFTDQMFNEVINTIQIYGNRYNLYNANGVKLETQIRFSPNNNTIVNSENFENYKMSNYFLDGRYHIKIDDVNYHFYWKEKDLYLELDKELKYVLKRVD